MKVLIVTSYDVGGACIAAIRLHKGLLELGVQSRLLTLHRTGDDIPEHYQWQASSSLTARLVLKLKQRRLHRLHQTFVPGRSLSGEFSFTQAPYDITQDPNWAWADVVNLHWVNEFVDAAALFTKSGPKPIVWTLHDMQAFTGGCHYAHHCNNHKNNCFPCPFLENSNNPQLAQKNLADKIKAFQKYQPKVWITTPSVWLSNVSKQSALFQNQPHFAIANGLNTSIYRAFDQAAARQILGLPTNKKIILGVSQSLQDTRKGFRHLMDAMRHLIHNENIILALVGKAKQPLDSRNSVQTIYLGSINDERMMAVAYNAADVVAIPSEEDNLPNVGIEALCCGTPVVGFNIGGIPDMVQHGQNGLLTTAISGEALSASIQSALFQRELLLPKAEIAAEAATKFSWEKQAKGFMEVFNNIAKS